MNFETLQADLESQTITGYDHHNNYINLPLISHVVDNLYVGGHSRKADLGDFFSHVFSFYTFEPPYKMSPKTAYRGYKMYDSNEYPDLDTLDIAVPRIVEALEAGGNVLNHCQAGINRSNLVAALVLREWKGMTSEEAVSLLRERRGDVVLSNHTFLSYLMSLDS